uniref:Gamma-butyrobetaine hydroxylase 1 n=1 Tax=Meleagris gallopavo TaxID=9103 RepID=A0A803XWL5_MELGA
MLGLWNLSPSVLRRDLYAEHRRDPTKVSMWRLAARVLLGTKVHPVTRRLLAGAANLQCCWWGTARRTYTGYMSAGIRKVEAPDAEHLVRVQWEDGSESCYPCVWLRDNCQCPHCFLHSAKARKLLFEDLDVDIVAKEVTLTDRRKISITWPDEHTSEYEAEWLKKRCFSEAARAEMREDLFLPAVFHTGSVKCVKTCQISAVRLDGVPVSSAAAESCGKVFRAKILSAEIRSYPSKGKKRQIDEHQYWGSDLQLPKMPFEEIMYNDESAYKWLCTLKKMGVVLLTGAATRQGELVKLGHRIGFLRLTFYGPTWQVQDKADANNVAYTTGKLCFHTDYPVLQHPPGVQFLHCIKQTATGDYTDIGVDYCDFAVQGKQRIIDVDYRGQAVRINFNNATRDTVFDIPAEEVRPFYAALKEFNDLLNSTEHKFTFKLKPGDIVTFDNWRVLHGRSSYQSGSEVTRHLEGAYADWDVVMSRLRLLRKRVLNRD